MTLRTREAADPGVPPIPTGTPAPYTNPDQHSWVLQTVSEMRESIGGLKQAVETLTDQSREQAKKIDGISHKVYAAWPLELSCSWLSDG